MLALSRDILRSCHTVNHLEGIPSKGYQQNPSVYLEDGAKKGSVDVLTHVRGGSHPETQTGGSYHEVALCPRLPVKGVPPCSICRQPLQHLWPFHIFYIWQLYST
jgi:hypothetical protein